MKIATFTVAMAALLPSTLASWECKDYVSRWDQWWYGVGPRVRCSSQTCHISTGHQKTVGWSVTAGASINWEIAKGASASFNSAYSYSESVTDTYEEGHEWQGPTPDQRLWLLKDFVVTDAQCRWRSFSCHPNTNFCDPEYGPWQATTWWVPCNSGNCFTYEVSDADGRCDYGNHCQQD